MLISVVAFGFCMLSRVYSACPGFLPAGFIAHRAHHSGNLSMWYFLEVFLWSITTCHTIMLRTGGPRGCARGAPWSIMRCCDAFSCQRGVVDDREVVSFPPTYKACSSDAYF